MRSKYLSRLKSALSENFINIPGLRIDRKIVVIESDDWGSIRMPSKEVYSNFISRGFNILNSDYNRYDTLESNDDLLMLYEVLRSLKDYTGSYPKITANFVVANPDFQKIKKSDFNKYYYEPVTDTLKRYPNRDQIEQLWKQGNSDGFFHPQFHCREHVNIIRWMDALRKRSPEIMFTFDNETTYSGDDDYSYMEVLDYNTYNDLTIMKDSLVEGLDLFEDIFGYRSKSFIPPCYTWDSEIENTLRIHGVKYIQGIYAQLVPTGSFGKYKKKYHFFGNRNRNHQYYLTRNCFFEPTLSRKKDPVKECLKQIDIAFKWKKPAIISSHRINFIGTLDENNRKNNLINFKELLKSVLEIWPEVEFMTSDQLGDLISGEDRYDLF